MPWPTVTTPKNNIVDGNQDPDLWREDLNSSLVDAHNDMVTARGQPDGVAGLDSNGFVQESDLPIVPIERGGTAAITAANARTNLQLGTAATKNVGQPNGVPTLDANGEVIEFQQGAFGQPANYVRFASGIWGPVTPGPSSITRTMLKTATQYFEANPSTGNWSNITLAAGQWGLHPVLEGGGGNNLYSAQFVYDNGEQGRQARIAIQTTRFGSSPVARGEQRYFLASPPYDFGDGECEDFLFLQYRNKQLVSTYFACDPPWANNGPTNTHNGIRLKPLSELSDPEVLAQYCEDLHNGKVEPVAEGMELKMYDMPLIPHPFDNDGATFIVDPMGDEIRQIRDLVNAGHSVTDFIEAGILNIDNTPLDNRHGPPGVPVVRARWKRTR